jgi:hypothetical protein
MIAKVRHILKWFELHGGWGKSGQPPPQETAKSPG